MPPIVLVAKVPSFSLLLLKTAFRRWLSVTMTFLLYCRCYHFSHWWRGVPPISLSCNLSGYPRSRVFGNIAVIIRHPLQHPPLRLDSVLGHGVATGNRIADRAEALPSHNGRQIAQLESKRIRIDADRLGGGGKIAKRFSYIVDWNDIADPSAQ